MPKKLLALKERIVTMITPRTRKEEITGQYVAGRSRTCKPLKWRNTDRVAQDIMIINSDRACTKISRCRLSTSALIMTETALAGIRLD